MAIEYFACPECNKTISDNIELKVGDFFVCPECEHKTEDLDNFVRVFYPEPWQTDNDYPK